MTFRDWIVVALSSRPVSTGNGYAIQFATDLALQACKAWGHDVDFATADVRTGGYHCAAKCQRCGVLVVNVDEKGGVAK
jgi:hypothetical protein